MCTLESTAQTDAVKKQNVRIERSLGNLKSCARLDAIFIGGGVDVEREPLLFFILNCVAVFVLNCSGLRICLLRVLFFAESAIGSREQAQSGCISRIGLGERFEIGQGAGKIRLLDLRFRQS